ncbi:MAG: aminotransferase [Faecalibacterium sp.]
MSDYLSMSREALQAELDVLRAGYEEWKGKGLSLDMSRGKPCTEQLDISDDILNMTTYKGESGFDARNYGRLEGMPSARRFFGELLGCAPEEVLVGGNSALQLMYFLIDIGWRAGFSDSPCAWRKEETIKFLCPVPGYDRHFCITETFGFEMINIPMGETGPDMDMVEALVKDDPSIKGMWCVPVYSNPDGFTYSDETVARLAKMQTAAPDFRLIWDNAYVVHHLTDEMLSCPNILDACKAAGHPQRPLMLCSTSKITYPGAGVAAIGASAENIACIVKNFTPMTISFDKMNQLHHVHFFQDKAGVLAHMQKHRAILEPKFDLVKKMFADELTPCGDIATWTDPKGGYFISLYLKDGCAKRTVQLCKDAGVVLTGAGAAYPYGKDSKDSHIRIAPTFPSNAELATATELLVHCVRLATVETLLG